MESADEVLTTYNVVAPVQQHHVGKPLQRIELVVLDIGEPSDLHQTPVDPGTSQFVPPQEQS